MNNNKQFNLTSADRMRKSLRLGGTSGYQFILGIDSAREALINLMVFIIVFFDKIPQKAIK